MASLLCSRASPRAPRSRVEGVGPQGNPIPPKMTDDDASLLSKLPPVSTCEIKEHLRFLRAVHVASSRGKGSLLYADGPSLRAAVHAYFAWLVKAAEPGLWSRAEDKMAGRALVTRAPPLGIAWCLSLIHI